MKDECFAIAAQLDVAFDSETILDGRLRRRQRVFDNPLGLVVQTAVGDRTLDEPGGRVDRRQGLISNMASTTASALSGTCDTPTVLRACWPRSPNTSAMRSDAPFIAWAKASKLEATLKNPP